MDCSFCPENEDLQITIIRNAYSVLLNDHDDVTILTPTSLATAHSDCNNIVVIILLRD